MRRLFLGIALALLAFVVSAQTYDAFGEHRYSGFRLAETDQNSIVFVGNSITNMRLVVSRIRHESPTTKVFVQGILPTTNTGRSLEKERQANDSLRKICAEDDALTYVDLWDTLYPICQSNTKNTSDGGCQYAVTEVASEHVAPETEVPLTDPTVNYYNLLPTPRRLAAGTGAFGKAGKVRVTDPTSNFMLAQFVAMSGLTADATASRTLTVERVTRVPGTTDYEVPGFGNEAYSLTITEDAITIKAVDTEGVNGAAATLMQLAAQGDLPCLEIVDWPSFKVRGYMHDVGRDFITLDELKHEMDLLARYKVNYFHWHLTENQAWRIEVKAYPQLTDASKMTRREGKYYSQADCRELIAYAKERGIVVVPEIDMPGHSEAFTRAMGYTMASAQGQTALLAILEEVADVFRESPYIHIGADETSVTAAFVQKMTAKIHALGKKAMTWNPISVSVNAANGIDACQLWSRDGGMVSGMVNIDSKYNYANLNDVFADLAGIFNSNCYYQAHGSSEMAGGVACVWTDRLLPGQKDIVEDNNFWATMLANAERLWQGGRTSYIEEAGCTLPNDGGVLERFRNWEDRFLFHKDGWLSDEPIPYVRQTNIRWRLTDAIPNGGDKTAVLPPETAGPQKSYDIDGTTYNTRIVTGGAVYLRHSWPANVPAVFTKGAGHTAYAWTYVYSESERDAAALIEFQNYERSWHDSAPAANQWDKKQSRLWVNDEELVAPAWQQAGQTTTFETLLTDENFTGRAPYPVHLKAGWNKVFVKLPYVNVSDIRLNRWMWTFVLTTPDGRDALDGVRYSPDMMMDDIDEQVQTFIESATAVAEGTAQFYSLSGHRVPAPAHPGVYILSREGDRRKVVY
ncbi:MAG: family 20 glycosylhydrolase [Bacteroidaceae bacterium]|nr:family 20 glycosylhydrolase [Bacteroidaceae bacterium]